MNWLLSLMSPGKLSKTVYSRLKPEERLSKEIADNCRAWTLEGSLRAVWTHIPNELGGGTRNADIRYAYTKHMGMIPGAPDLIFVGLYDTVFIELKAGKNTLNDNQKNFQKWCKKEKVKYHVCYSLEEVKQVLITAELLRL